VSFFRLLPFLCPALVLALAACDEEATKVLFLPETETPAATPAVSPEPTRAQPAAFGQFDNTNNFRAFGQAAAAAIEEADLQFFLDNVAFEDVECGFGGFPGSPPSCEGQSTGTVMAGILLGVLQSEGSHLDPAGYGEFLREFLTSFEVGATDAYGDAKPRLYAYGIFRPEFQSPDAVETIQAIATRIVPGPPPRFPPPGRSVLVFHIAFNGERWIIARLSIGGGYLDPITVAAFLNPAGQDAVHLFHFWTPWEGVAP